MHRAVTNAIAPLGLVLFLLPGCQTSTPERTNASKNDRAQKLLVRLAKTHCGVDFDEAIAWAVNPAETTHLPDDWPLHVVRVTSPEVEPLTDADLDGIGEFKALKTLRLRHTAITDKTLASLPELKHLESVSFQDSHVTNQGMQYLAQISSLEGINLQQTAVTDEGILQLIHLPRLTYVAVDRGQVSDSTRELFDEKRGRGVLREIAH